MDSIQTKFCANKDGDCVSEREQNTLGTDINYRTDNNKHSFNLEKSRDGDVTV